MIVERPRIITIKQFRMTNECSILKCSKSEWRRSRVCPVLSARTCCAAVCRQSVFGVLRLLPFVFISEGFTHYAKVIIIFIMRPQ